MKIWFGKHKGKLLERLLLAEPHYIRWIRKEGAKPPLSVVKKEIEHLLEVFKSRPFVVRCTNCKKAATRCTVYGNAVSPYWWCDSCDPYSTGAQEGKLTIIKTYDHAMTHVEYFCGDRLGDARELARALAEGKGLPKKATDAALEKLFS